MLKTIAALALVGVGFLSGPALADESGAIGCMHMQKQLSKALDANQQSPSYSDASNLSRTGTELCASGLYDQGLKRLAKALSLLGVNKS